MRLSRKLAFVVTLVCMLWCAAPSYARTQTRLILGLQDGAPPSIVTALGFTVLEARADLGLYLVAPPAGLEAPELLSFAPVRACCRFLEPDQTVVADQITLAFIERRSRGHRSQKLNTYSHAEGSPDAGPRSGHLRVAILDTGVDFDHPALAGHLARDGQDYVDGDLMPSESRDAGDTDGDGREDEAYGHGTHAAGLVLGLASDRNVDIVPFRVMDSEGRGQLFHVVTAVHDALAGGAEIIQMSLSCAEPSVALHDAIARARALGALIIASAGNEGSRSPRYPAAEDGVLAVAAADTKGVLLETSSFGAHVGLCADGANVLSTYPGGEYATWTGSSMATSLVTGAAVRAWRGADATRAQLSALAQDIDAVNPGKERELGTGLLRVQNPFSE